MIGLTKLKLGVFASGRGSNFEAIVKSIQSNRLDADVNLLITNSESAGALIVAKGNGIAYAVINKSMFPSRNLFVDAMIKQLKDHCVNFIVLAGYLKRVPPEIIATFHNRILNIHPALLPSFGGKGMYGHHVHEAVLARGCKITGVTVHLVNEDYDRGPIVAQRCIPVKEGDDPDTLAARVLKVEHQLYSETLQLFAEDRVTVNDNRVLISRGR